MSCKSIFFRSIWHRGCILEVLEKVVLIFDGNISKVLVRIFQINRLWSLSLFLQLTGSFVPSL